MRKISLLSISIILLIFDHVNATIRADTCFQHPYINLCWCYNASYVFLDSPVQKELYYKGMSKILNDYIKANIDLKKLKEGKFEVQTGCNYIYPSEHVIPYEISKGRKRYYVILRGAPDLKYMVRIVNYYFSQNWKSIIFQSSGCLECPLDIATETARKELDNVLEKEVGCPDMTFFDGKKVRVYEVGDLEIYYQNDGLFIYVSGKSLNIECRDPLPIRINGRYIIVTPEKILVFENNHIIAEKTLRDIPGSGSIFRMETYREWVNFYYDDGDPPFLIYSPARNKFYEIESK